MSGFPRASCFLQLWLFGVFSSEFALVNPCLFRNAGSETAQCTPVLLMSSLDELPSPHTSRSFLLICCLLSFVNDAPAASQHSSSPAHIFPTHLITERRYVSGIRFVLKTATLVLFLPPFLLNRLSDCLFWCLSGHRSENDWSVIPQHFLYILPYYCSFFVWCQWHIIFTKRVSMTCIPRA